MTRQEKLEKKLIQEPLAQLEKGEDVEIDKLQTSLDLLAQGLVEVYKEQPLSQEEFQSLQKGFKPKPYQGFQDAADSLIGIAHSRALHSLTSFAKQIVDSASAQPNWTDIHLLFDMQPVYFACKLLSKKANQEYRGQLFLASRHSHPEFYNHARQAVEQRKGFNFAQFAQLEELEKLEGDISKLPQKARFIDVGELGTLPKALAWLSKQQGKEATYFVGTRSKPLKSYGGQQVYASYYDIELIGQAARLGSYEGAKIKRAPLEKALILSLLIGHEILK